MGFTNPITGQNGALVRSNIHSPNYVKGTSGWTINKDGTVEFNSGTFRGNVVLTGSSALLEYSALALNGLIVALSPGAGSDVYGNNYNPGLNLFDGSGNLTGEWGGLTGFKIQNPGAIIGFDMEVSVPLRLFSAAFNDGAPSFIQAVRSDVTPNHDTLQVFGPSAVLAIDPNTSSVGLKFTSGNAANAADGRIVFVSSGSPTTLAQFTNGKVTLPVGATLNDKETINSSNTGGALSIIQSVTTTVGPGTISHQESASTNGAYAVFVAGDGHTRFNWRADGQLKWGSGSASPDAFLERTAAGILSATNSTSIAVGTAGQGYQVKEGTNAKMGTAVLAAGAVTVANTAVTANSRIFLTVQTPGGTVGSPFVNSRVAGTSFTIHSTSATDTSTVAYFIVEPA